MLDVKGRMITMYRIIGPISLVLFSVLDSGGRDNNFLEKVAFLLLLLFISCSRSALIAKRLLG